MQKQHRVLSLWGIVFALALVPARSLACTCLGAEGKTMREVAVSRSQGRAASQIIFEGTAERQELRNSPIVAPSTAMSITMQGAHRAVYFQVAHAYRGVVSKAVVVLTGMGKGDCGFDFETGKQYLVYAEQIDADNLFSSICTGTSLMEHAGPALRFLRGEPTAPDDLLDIESYYRKVNAQWWGTACGRVTKGDGTPLDKAMVGMTQVRDDPFPPERADDPNGTKPDGSFCIPNIRPGKYLLTVERGDYENFLRWMGYYPGVRKHSEAVPIEIHAGETLSDLQFRAQTERLYTVRFRIETSDGSPLPVDHLGIALDSQYEDDLAYHLTQNGNENGIFYAGYVPACYCTVQTYIDPDLESTKTPSELSKWRMAKQEVVIPADREIIVIKLEPKTEP